DLIAFAGVQLHLNQRRLPELLEHAVLADRFSGARVLRMRFLLNQRVRIPHEMIAPGARPGRGMSVDNRPIDAVGLAAPELLLEGELRAQSLREDHESRRVAIDAMDDV